MVISHRNIKVKLGLSLRVRKWFGCGALHCLGWGVGISLPNRIIALVSKLITLRFQTCWKASSLAFERCSRFFGRFVFIDSVSDTTNVPDGDPSPVTITPDANLGRLLDRISSINSVFPRRKFRIICLNRSLTPALPLLLRDGSFQDTFSCSRNQNQV